MTTGKRKFMSHELCDKIDEQKQESKSNLKHHIQQRSGEKKMQEENIDVEVKFIWCVANPIIFRT